MQLPAFWWLLALSSLIQGAFFARFVIVRMRGNEVQLLSLPVIVALSISCVAGLVYGIVQNDPLFILGQSCLVFIYYYMKKIGYDDASRK